MVDKKQIEKKESTKKVDKKAIKKLESREQAFKRLAPLRVQQVLNRIRILGNCSSRSNYEYTIEQVDEMYTEIDTALTLMYQKFTPSKQEQKPFKFTT